MKRTRLGFLAAVLVACGGATASIPDGGEGDASSAREGGGSGSGSGSTSGGGSGSTSGGGSGSTSGGGSGSTSGGGSGSTSGGGSGSTSGGGSGSSSGGNPSCSDLLSQINLARPAARMCCPTCNHAPCTFVVKDVCCPLTVDSQSSTSVTDFESAVSQFEADGCTTPCPAMPCPKAPSGMCAQGTSLCQ